MTRNDPFWDGIRDLVFKPSDEMVECHKPKPIIIPTGEASTNSFNC